MAIEITMPKLTDTMEEGTVVHWFKQVGESVNAGEILAEIETDKANMELEAEQAGVLTAIRVGEGETAVVGAVLALLADAVEVRESGDGAQPAPAAPERAPARDSAPRPAAMKRAPTPPGPAVAPPPARPVVARAPGPATTTRAAGGGKRVELSKMRQTIAKRMAEAKREVPHFYVTSEIDMGEALRLRESLAALGQGNPPVSVTHLLIKAVAIALQRHPQVNAAWDNGAVKYFDAVNIGIATAVDDGLLVPVLAGCEGLSLYEIAEAARQLAEKARGGRFGADEMLGGTFTISNLGMHDIEEFSAVITPPQAAILAVGAIKERAVARNGQLTAANTMRVTLSCDHRVLNGVEAARFLEELKRLLEHPVALVLPAQKN
jgi:pyruvate dehydrogenase E2 component (dihydrolipoamide acetyltransferase)